MYANELQIELTFCCKLLNFFGFATYDTTKREGFLRKLFAYPVALILLTLNALIHLLNIKNFLSLTGDKLIHKILAFFYLQTGSIKCITVAFTLIYYKTYSRKLWNGIMHFNQTASKLNLKHKSEKYLSVLPVFLSFVLHIGIGTVFIMFNANYAPSNKDWFIFFTLNTARAYELVIKIEYFVLITLFKNYYKQLNDLLKINAKNDVRTRGDYLKHISKCQQDLTDLVVLLNIITTPQTLSILQEAFVRLVGHTYSLIAYIFYGDYFFSHHIVSVFNVFDAFFNVLVLLAPAEICMLEVSIFVESVWELKK